jgi:hypothetical protein
MEADVTDEPDYLDPTELLSEATYDRFLVGGAATNVSAAIAIARQFPGPSWLEGLDPATALSIREAGLDMFDEDEDDNEWSPAVRAAIGLVAARAAYAGYVLGRVLLGTLEWKLQWSKDAEAGAQHLYDTVNRMEIVELALAANPALVDASSDYLHELAEDAAEQHDDIENYAIMAFDTALAFALVEHDQLNNGPAATS